MIDYYIMKKCIMNLCKKYLMWSMECFEFDFKYKEFK